MYLLFECGLCSSLYQVQIEKFSNSLQKVVCPSCQNFHYFSATQNSKEVQLPSIEKIVTQNSPLPTVDPKFEQRSINKEIFWNCGICEANFHFNLNAVTSQGIKVTCTNCFCFFILQKVGMMVDLDHMVMHEVSPDKIAPSQILNVEKYGLLPPMIEEGEVSAQFNVSRISDSPDEPAPQKAITAPSNTIPQISAAPKLSQAISAKPSTSSPSEKINEEVPTAQLSPSKPTSQVPDVPIISPAINAKPFTSSPSTKNANKEHMTQQPSTSNINKPLSKKNVTHTKNDLTMVNSFMSFQTLKHEFKLDKEHTVTFVQFNENDPKAKKNFFETHMIKISIWVAVVSVFFLGIVFAYEWYQSKHQKPEPVPVPVETNPNKPQYGFPVMEETAEPEPQSQP